LLSTISTSEQFQPRVTQGLKARIVDGKNAFVDEIEIDVNPGVKGGIRETKSGGEIGVLGPCG